MTYHQSSRRCLFCLPHDSSSQVPRDHRSSLRAPAQQGHVWAWSHVEFEHGICRKSAEGALEGKVVNGWFRRPVDGGCHYFSILNVHVNNKCAARRSICFNLLLMTRNWCVHEGVTLLADDFNKDVQRGSWANPLPCRLLPAQHQCRGVRLATLSGPGTRSESNTVALSNCRTSIASDSSRGWIPRLWVSRRRTNPTTLTSKYTCSTFAPRGPKATDVVWEAALRRSQDPDARRSSHNCVQLFRMLAIDDFFHGWFQHEFTYLVIFFVAMLQSFFSWWDVFLVHPLELHDWTCYFSFSYVSPAKYVRIRGRRYLREKRKIKGYSWRIHTNSLIRNHHLQPKVISSKRIILKSNKTTKSFDEDLRSMSGELQGGNVTTKMDWGSQWV